MRRFPVLEGDFFRPERFRRWRKANYFYDDTLKIVLGRMDSQNECLHSKWRRRNRRGFSDRRKFFSPPEVWHGKLRVKSFEPSLATWLSKLHPVKLLSCRCGGGVEQDGNWLLCTMELDSKISWWRALSDQNRVQFGSELYARYLNNHLKSVFINHFTELVLEPGTIGQKMNYSRAW